MNNTNITVRALLIVFAYAYCAIISQTGGESSFDEEPLLLTPLIDAGKLEDAKNQSRVSPAFAHNILSYAGYLTVNRVLKSHLYFWFFPCTDPNRNASAPLILWLQGGPGTTSLYGLFKENGPFEVTADGRLRKREHAWTTRYHMLYIDQPVGTGFSYAESDRGYASSQEEVADHLYEALTQFYKIFRDLKERDLYVAGESYAGKYIPAFGYKILTTTRNNSKSSSSSGGKNASRIPLKGMMIGNGYMDPENMLEYGEFLDGLGMIDKIDLALLQWTQNEIRRLIRLEEWYAADLVKESLITDMRRVLNSTSVYDYTRDNFNLDDPFIEFVSQNRTRGHIHAGYVKNFVLLEDVVYTVFEGDRLKTVRPWVEKLLDHYPILFYHGMFDIMVTHPMADKFLRSLSWSGAAKYNRARKRVWREDNAVAGYKRMAGNLVYVLVRNAGHMVPMDQPKNTLKLINMFVEKKLRDH